MRRIKQSYCFLVFCVLSVPAWAAVNWIEINGSAGAQQFFIDAGSVRPNAEYAGYKNFTGMFNLVLNNDDNQTMKGSIIGQFTLDCEKKKLRTNATKVYDQLNAKGELLEDNPNEDAEFFPLNDQVRAKAMLSVVCKIR